MTHFFGLIVLLGVLAIVVYSFGAPLFDKLRISPLDLSVRIASSTQYYSNRIIATSPPVQAPTANQPPQNTQPAIDQRNIPAGFTARDLSPYFGKVRFGSVSPGYSGSYSQVSLYAYMKEGESVNITGWLMKGNKGTRYVPQAVAVYDPSGLASETDIFLKSGETVNIYSTTSAIGKNLRLNKCVGYLENASRFTPSLYVSCPYVDRSEIQYLSGECQNYILSLGGCKLPDANPNIPMYDYACRAYLDILNYRGCFDRHSNDPDFSSKEWRVWIGSGQFLDSLHDRVLLFDRQGLLVDERTY